MKLCHKCGYKLNFCPNCGTSLPQNLMPVMDNIRRQNEMNIEDVKGHVIGAGFEGDENVIGINNKKLESNLTKIVGYKSNDKQ
jgi:hypothetical protein